MQTVCDRSLELQLQRLIVRGDSVLNIVNQTEVRVQLVEGALYQLDQTAAIRGDVCDG